MNLKTQSSDSCSFCFKRASSVEPAWKPTLLQARKVVVVVISASACCATFMQILLSINIVLTHKLERKC